MMALGPVYPLVSCKELDSRITNISKGYYSRKKELTSTVMIHFQKVFPSIFTFVVEFFLQLRAVGLDSVCENIVWRVFKDAGRRLAMVEPQVKGEILGGNLVFLVDALVHAEGVVCAPSLCGNICVFLTPNGFPVEVPRLAAPWAGVEIVWDEIPIGSMTHIFIFFRHVKMVK